MAPTSGQKARTSRTSKNKKTSARPQVKEFDIPYFAHQTLDPVRYYPFQTVTLPVGKPGWAPAPKEIATATNGGWEDEIDAPLEDDPERESVIETPAVEDQKRGRSSQTERNPYKRLKVNGGRPAVAKKVTADLDSDDELIVRMKNARYLEKDIADRLKEEGRINYNPKTIGTRWARLRKVLAARNDELLDAEVTDWHEGDDNALYQALQRADEITERAKQEADARKWRIVADQLKAIKPVTNFSQNACRQRYESLQAGTAKPTPESIDHPDDRVLKSIESRREKERCIENDMAPHVDNLVAMENVAANGWNSRRRR